MSTNTSSMVCFSSITVGDPVIQGRKVHSDITLQKIVGKDTTFSLILSYPHSVAPQHLPLLRLACIMPVINYGLFSKKIILNFSIPKSDLILSDELLTVFSRDIFVNKIFRRRTDYILPEFLPKETEITQHHAEPTAVFQPKSVCPGGVSLTWRFRLCLMAVVRAD